MSLALPNRKTLSQPMIDSHGRAITYVRLSLTDRCDLRCRYCMAETMRFLPNAALLQFDEIERLVDRLIDRGMRKLRLTGGEPLVRRDAVSLIARLGRRLGNGLDELTLTTNGTLLERFAGPLAQAGVRRINVSLDSLDPERFATITRRGNLQTVLGGIAAAKRAGLSVKINTVALKGWNDDELADIATWCGAEGLDLTLIETMPLGEVDDDRTDRYLPLDEVKRDFAERFAMSPIAARTGGPARYFFLHELGLRLGFITPLTDNFCDGCNRIRITATGTVYGCLGHDQQVDLRRPLRGKDDAGLDEALDRLVGGKPARHDFRIDRARPAVARHMSVTGG